ncbi:MAG TPA: hypothetical protein VGL07_17015 [Buttiauxella sp.]|jgi:hypothetical protein
MINQIKHCPEGNTPSLIHRRAGGPDRKQFVLKCECQCCRVAEVYWDSRSAERQAKHDTIEKWNSEVERIILESRE